MRIASVVIEYDDAHEFNSKIMDLEGNGWSYTNVLQRRDGTIKVTFINKTDDSARIVP